MLLSFSLTENIFKYSRCSYGFQPILLNLSIIHSESTLPGLYTLRYFLSCKLYFLLLHTSTFVTNGLLIVNSKNWSNGFVNALQPKPTGPTLVWSKKIGCIELKQFEWTHSGAISQRLFKRIHFWIRFMFGEFRRHKWATLKLTGKQKQSVILPRRGERLIIFVVGRWAPEHEVSTWVWYSRKEAVFDIIKQEKI